MHTILDVFIFYLVIYIFSIVMSFYNFLTTVVWKVSKNKVKTSLPQAPTTINRGVCGVQCVVSGVIYHILFF